MAECRLWEAYRLELGHQCIAAAAGVHLYRIAWRRDDNIALARISLIVQVKLRRDKIDGL